ncbi:MAG: TlpA family protein disulfide reductase, partial [Saprospiraceae bacterium]
IFLGLIITILGTFILINLASKRATLPKFFLLLLGPVFYFIMMISLQPWDSELIYNPILWAFSTFLVSYFAFKKSYKRLVFGGLVVVAYLFSYQITPPIESIKEENIKESTLARDLNENINLSDFAFLNLNLDTVYLKNEKILIETWNEYCGPCIASIKDLEPMIDSSNIKHIYLYENTQGYNLEKIKSFKHIKNKDKILIDINSSFFKSTKMESFPYFILFDDDGQILDYFQGYKTSEKEYFTAILNKMLTH